MHTPGAPSRRARASRRSGPGVACSVEGRESSVWVLEFGVGGLGIRVKICGSRRVWGLGLEIQGSGSGVSGLCVAVQDVVCRVWGFGPGGSGVGGAGGSAGPERSSRMSSACPAAKHSDKRTRTRKVDMRLSGEGNSIFYGARPIHQIFSMM